ncbi:MAG: IS66 family insertion sequence element accessory protein TnpA [Acidobacteriaceae bacterium]
MRQRRAEVWSKWRGLVSEQSRSGQGVAAFRRERSLREWRFYAWKKRLRESETEKFVEVKAVATREPKGEATARSLAIEIRLKQGRSLVVEPNFDASHLRALLAVLEAEA